MYRVETEIIWVRNVVDLHVTLNYFILSGYLGSEIIFEKHMS